MSSADEPLLRETLMIHGRERAAQIEARNRPLLALSPWSASRDGHRVA
jgi:hypothetical protein